MKTMETLLKDVRYGIRGLLKHPGFTAIVILTLAIGIGASTAIFTVVNSVMLRRLPYRTAVRVVAIQELNPKGERIQSTAPLSRLARAAECLRTTRRDQDCELQPESLRSIRTDRRGPNVSQLL